MTGEPGAVEWQELQEMQESGRRRWTDVVDVPADVLAAFTRTKELVHFRHQ